jgi:hypothetical protein
MPRLIFKYVFLSLLLIAEISVNNSVYAGGGEYEFTDDTGLAGPAYFGFVRQDKGSNIANAKVILKSKSGEKVELKSNVLGVYRSHFNKDTKPADVELICEKAGFKQIKVVNRSASVGRYVESDCIMQKTQ